MSRIAALRCPRPGAISLGVLGVLAFTLASPAARAAEYPDPVQHEVITQPYRVCQDLEELTSRINNLHRKPFHKLFDSTGAMQPETIFFKDVTSGQEIVSLTRELCNDIAHADLGRPVWTVDGRRILFMGNRGMIDSTGAFKKSAWQGKKYLMNADYTAQRAMVVTYKDAAGNVTEKSDGIEGKFNIVDPTDSRYGYYAVADKLWRVTFSDDGRENVAELLCEFATKQRKIIQAISADRKLLIQDLNTDIVKATGKPEYMPEIHVVDLNKKPGDEGYYRHHPFDYGLPEVKDDQGKVVHAADNNYQFHSLMFGKNSNTIGWNYGPMTQVGEYLGWSLDISKDLNGPPTHGKVTSGSGKNAWDQYESHGRRVGQSTIGLYYSGPAVMPDGKKIGEYALWMRDYAKPEQTPKMITPAPGGHVAGGESKNPYVFAAHIQGSSPEWRRRVKESDAIVFGDVRDGKSSVLCYTYSDVRGGIKKDHNSGQTKWSGMDNNDFRPYTSIPRPLLSPDATKVWFHSSMLMPYDEWNGIYVAVTKRPDAPVDLKLATGAKAVQLTWRPAEISNETKAYHVYRGDEKGANVVELTNITVEKTNDGFTATDATTEPGKTYTYAVTSEEWSTLESDTTSNALIVKVETSGPTAREGKPLQKWDKTAPGAVTDFTVVKESDEPGQYRLKWRTSDAPDIRYYNVYFSSTGKPQVSQKRLIASPLASMTEYLDWSAPLEGSAFYAITAVDRQGNESEPVFVEVK